MFNDIPAATMPATANNLQWDLFAKFRIAKTRVEWKKELEKCKDIHLYASCQCNFDN